MSAVESGRLSRSGIGTVKRVRFRCYTGASRSARADKGLDADSARDGSPAGCLGASLGRKTGAGGTLPRIMRLLPVLLALVLLPASACQKPVPLPKGGTVATDPSGVPIISWERAGDYETKAAIVEGRVVAVKQSSTVYLIIFHSDYHHTFCVRINASLGGDLTNAIPDFPDKMAGKLIRASGTIVHNSDNSNDKPEILLKAASDLKVV